MNRLIRPGHGMGALKALALAVPLWASSCASTNDTTPNQTGGSTATGGAGGATGGTGGSVGATGGTGGSVGGAGGTGGTVGGSAGVGTGGTPMNTGGAAQSGAGGDLPLGGSGGATAGSSTSGGASGDAGALSMGGAAGTGQGGSAGDAAGASPGGTTGQAGWFNGPKTPPPIGTWPPPNIKLTDVVTGVTQPTAIVAPRNDPTRIFVAEKWGRVRLIKNGVLQPTPALDIRDAVLEGGPQTGNELMNQGKRGLVGLALHPNYDENGRVFVMYVADQGTKGVYGTAQNAYDDGDQTFAEYKRSASNPDVFDPMPVGQPFLQFDKGSCNQCSQHNGGSLEVNVDGFLWASTGDPPPYSDAGSADLNNLNGKLLRFNISGATVTAAGNYPGADPFVASIGIRNTYKFSVDRYTGDLYVADVGENDWEEISVEPYGMRNKDYCWPSVKACIDMSDDTTGCLQPVFDYNHTGTEGTVGADNCIVGGYVYRGAAIPALQGAYIYGDNGSAKVRAIQVQNGTMVQGPHTFAGVSVFMGCFGEDAAGEMYVCDYNNNKVLRVDAQ